MHFWTQLVVDLMVYTSFYRYATPFFFFTLASTARSVGRFVLYFLLYFYMNIILWQNRSLGALGWTFSIFLFGIVSAVNQQFSLVSFSICAKIRKVLQMQTERQKSISNPRHANQINMFPFEMRAFCWCYCCLKAKAKSVQQSVVSLSGAGFRFYFFLRKWLKIGSISRTLNENCRFSMLRLQHALKQQQHAKTLKTQLQTFPIRFWVGRMGACKIGMFVQSDTFFGTHSSSRSLFQMSLCMNSDNKHLHKSQ